MRRSPEGGAYSGDGNPTIDKCRQLHSLEELAENLMVLLIGTVTLIGFVAGACTTIAFVPQVIRVWRLKDARDISLATFLVFSVGSFVWLIYGILIVSVPVILANAVTMALAITILSLKVRFDRDSFRSSGPREKSETPPA